MTIPNDQDPHALKWEFHHFYSLDTIKLFALMRLRVDVFVVEQACAYPELDSADTLPETIHLLGYADYELTAYARAMPGSTPSSTLHASATERHTPSPIRIGRVVVARDSRGRGIATMLMQQLTAHLQELFPGRDHCLAAQVTAQDFYASLGYLKVSDDYLEDGIAHVDMLRKYRMSATADT